MTPPARPWTSTLRRAALPAAAFAVVAGLHVLWASWFPEQDPAQARWAALPDAADAWLSRYVDGGEYWLAYAYGLSAALAAAALANLGEARRARRAGVAEGGLAAGSVTLAGALAAGGCFLVGCCGSPMLAVWASLLGAAFLPFAKPLVAGFTTVTVVAAWFWMARRRGACSLQAAGGDGRGCASGAPDATPGSPRTLPKGD